MRCTCRLSTLTAIVLAALAWSSTAAVAQLGPAALERGLEIEPAGGSGPVHELGAALAALRMPSVSVALIDRGNIAWARAWGDASADTPYQAASLSKLVTAVAALRLVERGELGLDHDSNNDLPDWHLPPSPLTTEHPVTLRGLLSMTAGIGVPGYLGYRPGAPLPTLREILDGTPPANSPPVRVAAVPGHYVYSGGGYEIVQALVASKRGPFDEALHSLVFAPAGMINSAFAQPPTAFAARAARGHDEHGHELPGGWRVVPELAAGGLWSTPTDLARLLVEVARAWRGEKSTLLSQATAVEMLTRQNGGPYGLGGAVVGSSKDPVLLKRGQNIGYQSYMLVFPRTGQGIVVMTGSDNGTTLATALIHRAAVVYGWPALGSLPD